MQHLIDVRNQLDRYASPEKVDWHLACINNRWTKRALTSAGFGYPAPQNDGGVGFERWKPIFSVAELGGKDSAAATAEHMENEKQLRRQRTRDIEEANAYHQRHAPATTSNAEPKDDIIGSTAEAASNSTTPENTELGRTLSTSKAYNNAAKTTTGSGLNKIAVVHGLNRPLFHIDLTSALQSAVANVERREVYQREKKLGTD